MRVDSGVQNWILHCMEATSTKNSGIIEFHVLDSSTLLSDKKTEIWFWIDIFNKLTPANAEIQVWREVQLFLQQMKNKNKKHFIIEKILNVN